MRLFLLMTILFCLPIPLYAATYVDSDNDGLSDELEIALSTDPQNRDTDGDGYIDGLEVENGYNPLKGNADRSLPRRVEVNKNTQQMKWFLNNIEVGSAPVSTGKIGTETPSGEFTILRKGPVVHYRGNTYNYPNTKWNLEFKKGYYLHGAYWHNQFGIKPMSKGCVNIAYKDAERIYKFVSVGDKVVITGKTPSGKVNLASFKD